jgi:Protein of unknown function (DUF742)
MTSGQDSWLDRDAGPVVRPYAVTRGRTTPSGDIPFDLIDMVVATGEPPGDAFRPGPEHRRLLRLCGQPATVVDLVGDIDLPLGVVRVLLSDLSAHGMIKITSMAVAAPVTDPRLLRDVLDGLRAL